MVLCCGYTVYRMLRKMWEYLKRCKLFNRQYSSRSCDEEALLNSAGDFSADRFENPDHYDATKDTPNKVTSLCIDPQSSNTYGTF